MGGVFAFGERWRPRACRRGNCGEGAWLMRSERLLLAVGGGALEAGRTAEIEGRVQAKRAVEAVGERSVGRRADRAVPGEALRLLFPFLPCASTGGPGWLTSPAGPIFQTSRVTVLFRTGGPTSEAPSVTVCEVGQPRIKFRTRSCPSLHFASTPRYIQQLRCSLR